MKHKYSKEILYHFQCSDCEAWWTIADAQMLFDESHYISCPICGHKEQATEEKEHYYRKQALETLDQLVAEGQRYGLYDEKI